MSWSPAPSESNRPAIPAGQETKERAVKVRGVSHQKLDDSQPSLEQYVFEHGELYDSYLATEPGREHFWATGNRGVISFVRQGRHVLVGGGLIAPAETQLSLLQEFHDYTDRLRLRPVFFGIREETLPLFRDVGYRITKMGEDAIVDLGDVTFQGKQFEWVRRQTNYCRRQGLIATEVRPDEMSVDEWNSILEEVHEISIESLADKPQSEELQFFDGRIGAHQLGLRRLFIARNNHGSGRIEGFIVCNPMENGRSWSTEIYRHRPDSVRGVIPFLMQFLILKLQKEGSQQVNLCIIPGQNCETPLEGDNPIIRRGLKFAENYFGLIFDLSGIRHFKSRFRPRYENRYLCAPPRPALGAFVATLKTFGVFRLDYRKTAHLLWGRIQKRAARKSISSNQ